MLLSTIEAIKGCWTRSTRVHKLLNYKIARTTHIYRTYVCKLSIVKILILSKGSIRSSSQSTVNDHMADEIIQKWHALLYVM